MKTRRLKQKQRGGMNCIRGCKRLTNKVKSFFYPKPTFPAYEKPTLYNKPSGIEYNKPPGIEFYFTLEDYFKQFKLRSPKDIQEACINIRRFIESTEASKQVIEDLGQIPFLEREDLTQAQAKAQAKEIFDKMELLLIMIISSPENDPLDPYKIGDEWSMQEKARIRGRMLVPAMTATRGGIENLLPRGSGPGPAGLVAELLGGTQITSGNLRRRRHSIPAERQLAALKAVATAVPGTTVGKPQHSRPLTILPNGTRTPIRNGNIVHVRRRN